MPKDAPHRWSGWPGAWCLDCGIEDPREVCIGTNPDCVCAEMSDKPCLVTLGPCPEPGSRRHDPYAPRVPLCPNLLEPCPHGGTYKGESCVASCERIREGEDA